MIARSLHDLLLAISLHVIGYCFCIWRCASMHAEVRSWGEQECVWIVQDTHKFVNCVLSPHTSPMVNMSMIPCTIINAWPHGVHFKQQPRVNAICYTKTKKSHTNATHHTWATILRVWQFNVCVGMVYDVGSLQLATTLWRISIRNFSTAPIETQLKRNHHTLLPTSNIRSLGRNFITELGRHFRIQYSPFPNTNTCDVFTTTANGCLQLYNVFLCPLLMLDASLKLQIETL